jgi:hypothetical protein
MRKLGLLLAAMLLIALLPQPARCSTILPPHSG